jgi:hypothetical protein
MKTARIAILGLFLCGALSFQLFTPAQFTNSAQTVEAKTDELSNTMWNVKNTIYALEFDDNGGVTLLEYNKRRDRYDSITSGTYRIKNNRVTLNYDGYTGYATISGRKRNVMTGKVYVKGKAFTIAAVRADN